MFDERELHEALEELRSSRKKVELEYKNTQRLNDAELQKATAIVQRYLNDIEKFMRLWYAKEAQEFTLGTVNLLQRLNDIASDALPDDKANLSTGMELLHSLASYYEDYISPVLDPLDPRGRNAKIIGQFTKISGLGSETFILCSKIGNLNSDMEYEEKKYAILGSVFMIAGIAILLSAYAQPITGPAVAAVTMLSFAIHVLGVVLAEQAIDSFEQRNHSKIEGIHKLINEIKQEAKQLESILKTAKRTQNLSFSTDPATQQNAEPEKPGFSRHVVKFFKRLFKHI